MAGLDRPKISVPMDLPGNSNKNPEPKKEEVQVSRKIVRGEVSRKESAINKFARSFFQEDVENIKEYVIFDVIVPEVKNTFLDVFEMMMFGEVRGRRSSRSNRSGVVNNTHTNYHRPSRNSAPERKVSNVNRRATHNFDDIIVRDRGDAEEVLSTMIEQLETYGFVSVLDFYELLGEPSTHADKKYGWSDLGSARIERSRDGYRFNLPRTRVLD